MISWLKRLWDWLAVAALIGMLLLAIALGSAWPIWLSLQSRSWTQVPCTILSSHSRAIERRSLGSNKLRLPDYEFAVRFEYEFQGQTYRSERFSFFRQRTSANDTHALVLAHPEGSRAICFVNPTHPDQAVMDRTIDPWSCALPIGVFAIGGILLLRWWLARRVVATTG